MLVAKKNRVTTGDAASARVTVVAVSDELAAAVLADATAGACEPPDPEGRTIPITFCHRNCRGGVNRSARKFEGMAWPDIRANYTAAAAAEVRGWRLLIVEDCDELVRVGAKKEAGQALGRLLNVTDGFIGHGLKLLVALTTNEPLMALHPAVVRAGRCLAEIHVGRLSRAEAVAWLGTPEGVSGEGATLAELLQLRGMLGPARAFERCRPVGMYL